IAMEQNDGGKAVGWFEKSVQLSPRNSVYFDWLGRAYGQQAQRASKFKLPFLAKKTKSAWDKSIELDPNNLDARYDMVLYYLQAPGFLGGGKEKAKAEAQEIKRRNPYRGAAASIRVCTDTKDQACLERELNFLVSSYPDSSAGYTSFAAFYTNNKQYDKAFAILDKRFSLKPNDPAGLYAYGRTASVSGTNLDRGEQSLRAYIAAPILVGGPPLANAHYRLGLIREKKGDKAGARAEYQTAVRLDPALTEAKKALEALR
ncbi:MAG TPA: tetratricopeptide repeat protein, partial [Gemmatimonadaceae bacterium]|nr:tetratricopeptide repeat protein [Gemmatimonadaceae bacterium]